MSLSCHLETRREAAFTLIELLIVIAIIAALAGMLMPMIRLAERMSKGTATRAVMAKLDTACRLFRAEIGPYPYQQTYADLAAGEAWSNRLFYQLGTDIAKDDRDKVIADGDSAAKLYAVLPNQPGWPVPAGIYSFVLPDLGKEAYTKESWGFLSMSNRMAAERARLAIYSGNIGITGPKLAVPYVEGSGNTYTRRVMPSDPLLTPGGSPPRTATSADRPGLARNYLEGELERSFISGDAVLDAWRRPLLYVCQVTEGMSASFMMTSQGVGALDSYLFGLQPMGRISLNESRLDRTTGQPVLAGAGLPDLNRMRHSDRRSHAPDALELEFELWSAGPDGRADWMRDAVSNTDNVPLAPYDLKIP